MDSTINFMSMRFTLATQTSRAIPVMGDMFTILENDINTNPTVSFDGNSYHEIPMGIAIKSPSDYKSVSFYNPSAVAPMTLFVCFTNGDIRDNRAVFEGDIDVIDIYNTIETPAPITALPLLLNIDNAAAVNVGGGVVGIPQTGQPFATGESITIAGTINYDGTYTVLGSSGANQVDITATFVVENFTGAETMSLTTPRSIAASSTRKQLEMHNHDAANVVFYGDTNVDPDNDRGLPIEAGDGAYEDTTAQIYLACENAVGVTGVVVGYANKTKT